MCVCTCVYIYMNYTFSTVDNNYHSIVTTKWNSTTLYLTGVRIITIIQCTHYNMGIYINGGTPKWMVYRRKSHEKGCFGGTPIYRNPHILQEVSSRSTWQHWSHPQFPQVVTIDMAKLTSLSLAFSHGTVLSDLNRVIFQKFEAGWKWKISKELWMVLK